MVKGCPPKGAINLFFKYISGSGKTSNLWNVGIGDEQYAWLKKTLETSKAKYKFVFAHHVLGTGRGAVEVSTNYEWGGKDPKGISTFANERPNWELPIHDLMVKYGVSIFFQGHDHIFVTQERDGLIYQSISFLCNKYVIVSLEEY